MDICEKKTKKYCSEKVDELSGPCPKEEYCCKLENGTDNCCALPSNYTTCCKACALKGALITLLITYLLATQT